MKVSFLGVHAGAATWTGLRWLQRFDDGEIALLPDTDAMGPDNRP